MVAFGLWAWSGPGQDAGEIRRYWEQFFSQYEGLKTAVLTAQVILFASFFTAMLTVWILYKRVPGTLNAARQGLVAAVLLRIVWPWIFFLMISDIPIRKSAFLSEGFRSLATATAGVLGYIYLSKSRRVRETFHPGGNSSLK